MLNQKLSFFAILLVDTYEKRRTTFLPFTVLLVFISLGGTSMILAHSNVSPNLLFNRKSIKGCGYFTLAFSPKPVCFKSPLSFLANEDQYSQSSFHLNQFCLYLTKSR